MIRRNYTLSCQNSTLSIFLFQNFFSISTENEITQRIKIKYYVSKTAYKTYDISTISSYIFSYQNSKSFYFKMKLFKGSFSIKNPHVSKKRQPIEHTTFPRFHHTFSLTKTQHYSK